MDPGVARRHQDPSDQGQGRQGALAIHAPRAGTHRWHLAERQALALLQGSGVDPSHLGLRRVLLSNGGHRRSSPPGARAVAATPGQIALTPLAPGSPEAALNRRHAVKACAAGYRDASDKYADLAKVRYAPSELIEHR